MSQRNCHSRASASVFVRAWMIWAIGSASLSSLRCRQE
jgi:hypothetical protein